MNQSVFRWGRYSGNNIRLIWDLIDYGFLVNDDSHILFIDYYKAFDTVNHNFLFEVLDFFGFGNNFICTVRTLYKNCNSSVKQPFGTTPRLDIDRGVTQGHPLSPLLFLLVTQVMYLHIKINPFQSIPLANDVIKCSQLTDDTAIFL